MFGQPSEANHWFFETIEQTEALNRLMYVVENGEAFCVLEGAYGTGKSTVLRKTVGELGNSGRRAVYLNVASLDCRAILWHLSGALSIFSHIDTDASDLMMLIRDELTARAECSHPTVVLLDDVDLAQENVQSVLHLLTSIAESSRGQIALLAATELPLSFAIQQRTTLHVALDRLEAQESVEFAVRYLASLKCDVDNVTSTGWRAIADLGEGLPARLMRVCRIVEAVAGMQDGTIDAALIHEAARELLPSRAA